jgi:hypothetical protein
MASWTDVTLEISSSVNDGMTEGAALDAKRRDSIRSLSE